METVGHHSCYKDGGYDFVLENAPFIANHNPDTGKKQFLGTGYYFWDDNLDMALYWGKNHYDNNFYIIECDLCFHNDCLLDLIGIRNHQKYLMQVREKLAKLFPYTGDTWSLGTFIEFLKYINENDERYRGIFNFKAVRAVDVTQKSIPKIYFVQGKGNYTNLNPRYVICLYEKNELILRSKKIIDNE